MLTHSFVFSVTKAVTAVALHIQAERGLVDYAMPTVGPQCDVRNDYG